MASNTGTNAGPYQRKLDPTPTETPEAAKSIHFMVSLPMEVVLCVKEGGLQAFLSKTPDLEHNIASAIRALDDSVSTMLNTLQVVSANALEEKAKDEEPWMLEVKRGDLYDYRESPAKMMVQVCNTTTLHQLVQAIECEHDFAASSLRLVVMGKTLYNPKVDEGLRNSDRTIKELGITTRHVVWIKDADNSKELDV